MATAVEDVVLPQPPRDGISRVRFSPDSSDMLLVSSWDTSVRLYDTKVAAAKATYHHNAAVLDCTFGATSAEGFSGGLDCTVRRRNFVTGEYTTLGSHDAPVRCVEYSAETGLLVSGSWDQTVKLWDARLPDPKAQVQPQCGKVFAMSVFKHQLVVGTHNRMFDLYDLRKLGEAVFSKPSSQKFQTRCVTIAPTGDCFAVGSIEGRVSVESMNSNPTAILSFKCHRISRVAYPVNSIAYHPQGKFLTASSDGTIVLWDPARKKRVKVANRFGNGVASVAMNSSGSLFAAGVSYGYEKGEVVEPPPAVIVSDFASRSN